jgi:putative ABC transport system permease protein
MTTVWEDVKYATRLLLRQPVFTLTVLLALAAGIGANSAIFSVVNSVLLRPLPYGEPGRLYFIWASNPGLNRPQAGISPQDLLDLQKPTTSFTQVAGMFNYAATQTREGEPQRIMITLVSPNYFETLGVRPLVGRDFEPKEGTLGNNNVVILANGFWRRRYGGDPAVVGKTTMLDGELHTIVGVLPELAGDYRTNDVFIPLAFGPEQLGAQGSRYLNAVARLKPGVSTVQAEHELASLATALR